MHDPHLLILDEPFSGLDPQAVDTMTDMLRQLMRKGVPVLFSSHQLDLVDRLCDRVIILDKGHIKASGTADELRRSGPVRFRYTASQDAGWLRELRGVKVLDVNGDTALLELADGAPIDAIRHQILSQGLDRGMMEFFRVLPTLGDIYRGVNR